jgi:tetratricopeptide (TPR) repeat protein
MTDTYFASGMTAYVARNFEEAVGFFSKVILENPENVNYYFYRGAAFQELGNFSEAENDYTQALKRLPDCIPIRYHRSEVRMLGGKAEAAGEDFTFIIDHAGKGEEQWLSLAYLNRGLCRIEAGSLESALADFDQAETLAKELGDKLLLARIGDELEKSGF